MTLAYEKGHEKIVEFLKSKGAKSDSIPNKDKLRAEFLDLVSGYTAKQLTLNRMLGVELANEDNVLSLAEKDLREKYFVPDPVMRELRKEASGLMSIAKRAAEGLYRNK